MPKTAENVSADAASRLRPAFHDVDEGAAPLAVLEAETGATLSELRAEARRAAEEARAASIECVYAAEWRDFSAFCARIGREHLSAEPETIALYLADLMHRGRAASTWERRLAAIGVYRRATGFESPTEHEVVRSVHRGLRRRVGVAQSQKTALIDEGLRAVVGVIDDENLAGARDRALLLVGFAGALRRSELAALEFSDLRFESDGLVVRLRRSKGDQEGAGVEVSIPLGLDEATCPLGALQRWLEQAKSSKAPSSGGSIGTGTPDQRSRRRRSARS
jgi:site-specific recombinase XerD